MKIQQQKWTPLKSSAIQTMTGWYVQDIFRPFMQTWLDKFFNFRSMVILLWAPASFAVGQKQDENATELLVWAQSAQYSIPKSIFNTFRVTMIVLVICQRGLFLLRAPTASILIIDSSRYNSVSLIFSVISLSVKTINVFWAIIYCNTIGETGEKHNDGVKTIEQWKEAEQVVSVRLCCLEGFWNVATFLLLNSHSFGNMFDCNASLKIWDHRKTRRVCRGSSLLLYMMIRMIEICLFNFGK